MSDLLQNYGNWILLFSFFGIVLLTQNKPLSKTKLPMAEYKRRASDINTRLLLNND